MLKGFGLVKKLISIFLLSSLSALNPFFAVAQENSNPSELKDKNFIKDENWETFVSISEQNANSIGYDGIYFSDVLNNGVKIEEVEIGSPAEKAGIRAGDIVIAVNGKSVLNMKSDDIIALSSGKVGDSFTYTILDREKSKKYIKIVQSKEYSSENLFPVLARHSLMSSMNALSSDMLTIAWTSIANLYACSSSISDLNEFERVRYKKSLVERWSSRTDAVKNSDTIYIPVAVHLGEYDFKYKRFEIEYFDTSKGFKLGSMSFERDSRLPSTYLGNGILFGDQYDQVRKPETVPINAVVVDTPNGAERNRWDKSSTECVNESKPDNLTFASGVFHSGVAVIFRYSKSLAKKVSSPTFKANSLDFFDLATLKSVPTNVSKGVGITIDPIYSEPEEAEKLLQIIGENRILYYVIEGKVISSIPSNRAPENTSQGINGEIADSEKLIPTVVAVPLTIHVLAPNMQEIATKEINWAEGTGEW